MLAHSSSWKKEQMRLTVCFSTKMVKHQSQQQLTDSVLVVLLLLLTVTTTLTNTNTIIHTTGSTLYRHHDHHNPRCSPLTPWLSLPVLWQFDCGVVKVIWYLQLPCHANDITTGRVISVAVCEHKTNVLGKLCRKPVLTGLHLPLSSSSSSSSSTSSTHWKFIFFWLLFE